MKRKHKHTENPESSTKPSESNPEPPENKTRLSENITRLSENIIFGSLNNELSGMVFTKTYYRYASVTGDFLISDGIKYIAGKYNLNRFLDIICAYQVLKGMPMLQVWELDRYIYNNIILPYVWAPDKPWRLSCYDNNTFWATCTDINHTLLQKQFITHYEFIKSHVKVLLVGNIIMLPSEYS
jgi:hypothetical protein